MKTKIKKIYNYKNIKISNYKKKKIFLVEGIREFRMALRGNFNPIKIFICESIFSKYFLIKPYYKNCIIYSIRRKIFNKIVYRKDSEGILGFFKEKNINNSLKHIKLNTFSLIIILDGIEKPGNIGAIFRIANAANINLIILCNVKTYIFNPNVIRSSLGCIFLNQIIVSNHKAIISWLKEKKIKIFVTGFSNVSKNLYTLNFSSIRNIAIVFGSENKGVSKIWFQESYEIINIPMCGYIDSLNVSNAVSIVIYEILRQKKYRT